MKRLTLANPDGKLVRFATITELRNGRWWLSISTIYCDNADQFKSERAAKYFMAREYQKGCKWIEVAAPAS